MFRIVKYFLERDIRHLQLQIIFLKNKLGYREEKKTTGNNFVKIQLLKQELEVLKEILGEKMDKLRQEKGKYDL